MKLRILCVSALTVLTIVTASAQTKTTMSGKCSKANVQQSIPAGDQQGHVFTLAQGKCTVTGDVAGAAGKEGAYSSHAEMTPTHLKEWGVYTVTFENGDKIYYNYQGVGTMKDGALQGETNKYQIAGGTGKMKGLKGSGGCKLTPTSDGGVDYSCTGDYSSGGTAMAKP